MPNLEVIATLCSIVGLGSLINFFVQRHFSKKDEETRQTIKKQQEEQKKRDEERAKQESMHREEYELLAKEVEKGLATIRLLSYARVAEEADRLIDKGWASAAERRYLYELNENYKDWGWNGDMKGRMRKVDDLTDSPQSETE